MGVLLVSKLNDGEGKENRELGQYCLHVPSLRRCPTLLLELVPRVHVAWRHWSSASMFFRSGNAYAHESCKKDQDQLSRYQRPDTCKNSFPSNTIRAYPKSRLFQGWYENTHQIGTVSRALRAQIYPIL